MKYTALIITFIGFKLISIDRKDSIFQRSLLGITFKSNGMIIDLLFFSITIR